MKERNGTSYSFGLRLWEIYNRRVIEAANQQERLVTHYDLFFEDPESELRRIAEFIGLPDAQVSNAGALVTKRRRHTHFTVDHLIDARVAPEVIDLYRALVTEVSAGGNKKAAAATTLQTGKSEKADLLPGAVSRLNAFVPERIAQIERLYGELLAQTEARHKTEIKHLKAHLEETEVRHKSQVEELTDHLVKTEAQHKAQVEELSAPRARSAATPTKSSTCASAFCK